MKFRLTAFALHLLGSATALILVLGALYLGWYRWPGWYLSSVLHMVGLVVLVDLALGPTLTFIVATPAKAARVLARDIGIIVTVQIAALIYGTVTLWQGRPLYYAFSVNSLDMVQASALDAHELALARQQNPSFAPHWYSRPRWIWAPLPEDYAEATKIATGTIFGGSDVTDMPRYFKAWDQGLSQLREHLTRLDDVTYLSRKEKQTLRATMSARGLAPNERNALIMWGGTRRVLAVFDPSTLQIKALLKAD
ncbi:MAG TPA: hypothetical protein VKB72_07215 [Steroidobacteraceae bacterium]|nr:hypothetical protein [Steroidobacteraceae bacterium]